PEFPDDLQVIVHDGSTHASRRPEVVWVQVTGCQGNIFSGVVLNQPNQLQSVAEGSNIQFVVPESGPYPLMVTTKYLEQRSSWRLLQPCRKCGLSELFDAPSDLVAASFPSDPPIDPSHGFTFTTRCGWCGSGLVVRIKRIHWPWSQGGA